MDVNDNESNKTPGKPFKVKAVEHFNWKDYLEACHAEVAPDECFTQNIEPPENDFEPNQKLEVTSADGAEFVHLATVISKLGPRLQLRLDGCDNSNDFYELVDSDRIHPFGTSDRKGWFRAAPLRFRKDAAGYRAFCSQVISSGAVCAPESCFKKCPKVPQHNLFKVGQKLEAVDVKHPSNICPATIMKVENNKVEVHLDGWDHNNDYKCFYYSRNLFPVGWCSKTGHILQHPGPKDERKIPKQKSELEVLSIKSENSTSPSDNEKAESTNNKLAVDSPISQSSKSSPVDKLHLNVNGAVSLTSSKSVSPKLNNGFYSNNNNKSTVATPNSSNSNSTQIHQPKTITIQSKNKPSNEKSKGNSFFMPSKPNSSSFVTPKSSNPSLFASKPSSSSLTSKHSSSSFAPKSLSPSFAASKPGSSIYANSKPSSSSLTASKPTSNSSPHTPNDKPNHTISVGENTNKVRPSSLTNGNSKKRPLSTGVSPSEQPVTKKKPSVNGKNGLWYAGNNLIPSKEIVERWSPNHVVDYLLITYPELKDSSCQVNFLHHEIDGSAFLLLNTNVMCRYLGLKLGHSLKIKNLVEMILEQNRMENCN